MSIAFCYPGQGVQHVGMAEGFVKADSAYADMVAKASEASGIDMNKLLFEENEDINITEYTQPALVTACCIITDALLKAGIKPDVTAGLSLGEYCSLYVAGALGFEDAVRLTRIRGRLMSNAVPAGEGTMAAVIGLTQEQVEAVTNTIENVWPANFNCPGQIVITGKKEAVHEAMPKLSEAGAKKVVELNVSGPFHSPLLKVAGEELGKELANVEFDAVRGVQGIKEATVKVGDTDVNVAVVHGLGNARKVLDSIKAGEKSYHFIEVMACPGGCVTGGGQPIVDAKTKMDVDVRAERAKALYAEDRSLAVRQSHKNPAITKLYDEYLEKPGSHKAHGLLHTHYTAKSKF